MASTSEGDASEQAPVKYLLSIREAAALLNISETSLRRWIAQMPEFPIVRVSPGKQMIPRGRLMDWLGEHHLDPVPALAPRRRGLRVLGGELS